LPEVRSISEAKDRAMSIYEELSRDAVEVDATIAFNEAYMPECYVNVGYDADPDPLGPFARAYYVNEVTHKVAKAGASTTVKAMLPVEEFRAKG
jgi:hypothetical protein